MKKKETSLKARIIATLVSMILVICMIPLARPSAAESLSNSSTILSLDSEVPSDFDANDTSNPYGKEQNEEFMLATEDEYLLYQTTRAASSDDFARVAIYDGITLGGTTVKDGVKHLDSSNLFDLTSNTLKNSLRSDQVHNMSFVSAVSFNPLGGTRDNWVAYIGAQRTDSDSAAIYLWVQCTSDMSVTSPTKVCDADYLLDGDSGIAQYKFKNFFQITAGDYDNDGKDTIIVYAAGDVVGNNAINEYSYSAGNMKLIESIENYHITFQSGNNNDADTHLAVSLATGDFNGDGIDQLAIATYNHQLFVSSNDKNNAMLNSYSSIVSIWNKTSNKTQFSKESQQSLYSNTTGNEYQIMLTSSIAAGDTDNDGCDEIIAAGYTAKATFILNNNDNTYGTLSDIDIDNDNFAYSIININGTQSSKSDILTSEFNTFYKEDIGSFDVVRPPLSITAVAFNGASCAEYVFIAGDIFDFSGTSIDATTSKKYTYSSFNDEPEYSGGSYVETSVTGNFVKGQQTGREQVLFTIAEKKNGDNRYSYSLGYITGTDYQDDFGSGTMDNKTSEFAETTFTNDKFKFYTQSDDDLSKTESNKTGQTFILSEEDDNMQVNSRGLNFVLVSMDFDDNDGVMTRYNDKNYSYTDPQVEAVLQAAPYFGELGDFGSFDNNATSYSVVKSYSTSTSETDSVSFGCGFAGSLSTSVGEAMEISTQLGYSMDWDSGFEKSFETTYTTTWTATEEDVVVICRTPVFHYFYDVFDTKTYEWKENELTISVPQKPMYYMLNVEQYNEFVDEYNGYLEAAIEAHNNGDTRASNLNPDKVVKLIAIDDSIMPENNEGNPTAYYSSTAVAGTGAKLLTESGTSDVPLGHGGGTVTLAMDTLSSETSFTSISHGFISSFSCMAGAGLFGTDLMGGYYVDLSYSHDVGSSTTTANGIAISGTVSNISNELNGHDSILLNKYGFNWNFGQWERALTTDNVRIPIVGYYVNNLTTPGPAPRNLNAFINTSDDSIALTWEKGNSSACSDTLLGYNIYRSADYTDTIKLNDDLISKELCSSTDDDELLPGKLYTYYIKAVYQTENGKTTYESLASNSSSIISGTTGSDGIQGIPGTNGTDGITPTIGENGNWWLGSKDTGVAATGANGVNGLTPYIGENGNWWIGSDDTDIATTGDNGLNPYIGENGDWWIGLVDTGVVATGPSGLTPAIGENGNWWIGSYDTGVAATGDNGLTPTIGSNGNWWIGSSDTYISAIGVNGLTPAIGENGNWWIGTVDTGVAAIGTNGLTPYIGEDGNWWIGSTGTGVPATGADGVDGDDGHDGVNGQNGNDGANGVSGTDGLTPYIGENNNWWIGSTDTGVPATGADGVDGQDGKDGIGITNVTIDNDGYLILTLDDGSTINAGMVRSEIQNYTTLTNDTNEAKDNSNTAKTLATAGLGVSSVSLIWNVVSLTLGLVRKKISL